MTSASGFAQQGQAQRTHSPDPAGGDEVVKVLYIPANRADNAWRQAAIAGGLVEAFIHAWNDLDS